MVIRVEAVDSATGTLKLSDGKILKLEDPKAIQRYSLAVGDLCALSRATEQGFSLTLFQVNYFKAETLCTPCNGHFQARVVSGVEKRAEEPFFHTRRL
jgi:hypothetical protein